MNWPLQGLIALKVGVGWFIALMLIVTSLTRHEKKYVPQEPDEH